MLRSLHREKDLADIKVRIARLRRESKPRWGRMDAAQMLTHCRLVLEVPLQKTILPKPPLLIRTIGILTKKEMKIFHNGIPPYMPTFAVLKAGQPCEFEPALRDLVATLDRYTALADAGGLPSQHALFGRMEAKDWGFLEYKHLHHHLKQFGL